jgi:hypothetical protein
VMGQLFLGRVVTLHHAKYDKESKKLQIGRVNLKDKKVTGKWSFEIEIKGVRPSRVLNFIKPWVMRWLTR